MSIGIQSTAAASQEDVEYPSSDGQPMAETGLHVQAILQLFESLLDARPATDFIAADMFWYWEEGHPASCVAPDVMVVKGIGRSDRRSFFTWREGGAVPCAVFEMASQNTWREDLGRKRQLYERLGVREYFLFDPEGEYLRPPLRGFRLREGRYDPIDLDADERLSSEELGVLIRAEGLMLRLLDGSSGAPLPTRQERIDEARRLVEQERRLVEQERRLVEQERRRADVLAAEVVRLKALLEQARAESEGSSSE